MIILLDTNVLLRITETESPDHTAAIRATRLLGEEHTLVTVPQIAYEFWSVATRTVDSNGLGMTVEEASDSLQEKLDVFPMLRSDERGVFRHWWDLVNAYQVKGVKSHDTRIVASMIRHNIDRLLTFNARDFNRYKEVTVLTPKFVLANE